MPMPTPSILRLRAPQGRPGALALIAAIAFAVVSPGGGTAAAEDAGLVTEPSATGVRTTVERFITAVRAAGWVVFGEVDHAGAAATAGLDLRPRTVILFGNPAAGTPAMRERPTLALDLPMRVLVWEDDQGRAFVTRSSGSDLVRRVFARHGIAMPDEAMQRTEAFLRDLVGTATRQP